MALRDLDFTELHVPWPDVTRGEGPSVSGLVNGPAWTPLADLDGGMDLCSEVGTLMPEVTLAHKRVGGDDPAVDWDGVRYRVSVIPEHGGHSTWILSRALMEVPQLAELGLPARIMRSLDAAGTRERPGLVLMVGPMREGKTTLACSVIRHWLETHGGTGLTLEDPPELMLSGRWGREGRCWQRPVIGDDWASPLRDMLRSRARYHLLSEIRSMTAAAAALRLATVGGASVLSTIHGNDVLQGITALADYAVPARASSAEALAAGLRAVLRTKLVADNAAGRRRIRIEEALVIDGPQEPAIRKMLLERRFNELRGEMVLPRDLGSIGVTEVGLPPRINSLPR